MSETRIGGVTARFNEDGTLYIYQPDSNRVLSPELAEQLVAFLAEGAGLTVTRMVGLDEIFPTPATRADAQSTVPAGVINTTTTGGEPVVHDVSAPEGVTVQPEPQPAKRGPGRPRRAQS